VTRITQASDAIFKPKPIYVVGHPDDMHRIMTDPGQPAVRVLPGLVKAPRRGPRLDRYHPAREAT
jgi:hypothetical protein